MQNQEKPSAKQGPRKWSYLGLAGVIFIFGFLATLVLLQEVSNTQPLSGQSAEVSVEIPDNLASDASDEPLQDKAKTSHGLQTLATSSADLSKLVRGARQYWDKHYRDKQQPIDFSASHDLLLWPLYNWYEKTKDFYTAHKVSPLLSRAVIGNLSYLRNDDDNAHDLKNDKTEFFVKTIGTRPETHESASLNKLEDRSKNKAAIDNGLPLDLPAWKKFAYPFKPSKGLYKIAVVIDDFGLNKSGARKTIALPGPLTLSFMTYAKNVQPLIRQAKQNGHEIMLHVPMEPMNSALDTGPNALLVDLSEDEIHKRLVWGLEQHQGYIGINNHMGSRFTSDKKGMEVVLKEVKKRGLMFLDSVTIGSSLGADMARDMAIPYASRDVFLDHEISLKGVRKQLRLTQDIARKKGFAIAIGHPHAVTIKALGEWIPTLREQGFELVPISSLLNLPKETAPLASSDQDETKQTHVSPHIPKSPFAKKR